MYQKLKIVLASLMFVLIIISGGTTFAAVAPDPPSDQPAPAQPSITDPTVKDPTFSVPTSHDKASDSGNCKDIQNCDLISNYVIPFLNLVSAAVGVAVVISIIMGGIQYSSSGGDPQKVTAAKGRIRNAVVALVTYTFLWALLNFLVPGGILHV